MKKFKVVVWRSNPQLANGGYEMIKVVRAKSAENAKRNVNKKYANLVYGSAWVQSVELADENEPLTEL